MEYKYKQPFEKQTKYLALWYKGQNRSVRMLVENKDGTYDSSMSIESRNVFRVTKKFTVHDNYMQGTVKCYPLLCSDKEVGTIDINFGRFKPSDPPTYIICEGEKCYKQRNRTPVTIQFNRNQLYYSKIMPDVRYFKEAIEYALNGIVPIEFSDNDVPIGFSDNNYGITIYFEEPHPVNSIAGIMPDMNTRRSVTIYDFGLPENLITFVHEIGHALNLRHSFHDKGGCHKYFSKECMGITSDKCNSYFAKCNAGSIMDYSNLHKYFSYEEISFLALAPDFFVCPGSPFNEGQGMCYSNTNLKPVKCNGGKCGTMI